MQTRNLRVDIEPYVVTAEQMQQIEGRLFEAGMPVAALMEKVSAKLVLWFVDLYAKEQTVEQNNQKKTTGKIGVLAGPGHNGGDALVVARELHHQGFAVQVYQPFAQLKSLTQQHANYAKRLGISFVSSVKDLADCDAIVDGWFGFGLTRPIIDSLASDIRFFNQLAVPIFSIDLPSGIHTDTGQVMGEALSATHTVCLGLWKRAFMQEKALAYLGESYLIDFDIPLSDIDAVLGENPKTKRIIKQRAIAHLPLHRSLTAHKYTAGHLLLIAGSRQYAGAALLAGLGAIASGVGMLTLAIPESIRLTLLPQLPSALLVGCPETEEGAIAQLPDTIELSKYDAIAFGPGLTSTVPCLLKQLLSVNCPLLLDADGLNLLAKSDPVRQLKSRTAPTILTPHYGEFKRLFPEIAEGQNENSLPGEIARQAAQVSGAVVLLKGARSAIAADQTLWFNPDSTPALARGGSGDVLTGLMGGLIAAAVQSAEPDIVSAVTSAVWWHSQAALFASSDRTILGVDPHQLALTLNQALQNCLNHEALT